MDLATFFQKFDQFADAPDAVAKLRELVLELAATGRLVPDILERPVADDTKLMGSLVELVMGQAPAGTECNTEGRGTVFVKVGEFGPLYPREEVWTTNPLKFAKKGDVLVCVVGATVGKLNLAIDCAIGRSAAAIRPSSALDTKFLYYSLIPYTLRLRRNSRGSAQGVIGKAELNAVSLWVPSREVQKRIVAKVDELMALCDRLEAQQQERETRHAALARASLSRFAEAPTPANLEWIFHPSYTVTPADLRKAILTLAVQGKLVPQEHKEGCGNEVLNSLRACKHETKEKLYSAEGTDDASLPFPVPDSWTFARLGEIYESSFYGPRFGKEEYVKKGGIPTIRTTDMTAGGQIVLRDPPRVKVDDPKRMALYAVRSNDLLVTRSGTIGTMAVFKEDYVAIPSAYLIRFRFPPEVMADFYYLFLGSPYGNDLLGLSLRSIGVPNVNATSISKFVAPIPPLAEQRRIVAKVHQLMALVDALETQLAASRATAANLLSALVAELTAAAPSSTPAPASRASDHVASREPEFIRSVFAAEVIDRLHAHDTFGQVKLQKVLHLAEYIFQLREIDSHPLRYAAGPHDPQLIREVEHGLRVRDWFSAEPRADGPGHVYRALSGAGSHRDAFTRLWPAQAIRIRAFLDELRSWKTERCERFATLYAAWNDLLIWGKKPTDAAILEQVLEKWDPAKKRIPRDLWLDSLRWMRDHGYVPTGFGRATTSAPQAELSLS
jgi:type I restriction enzyme, S subunit